MLSNVNSTPSSWVTLTISQRPINKYYVTHVRLVALHCAKYNGGVWNYGRMIIDQAIAAAESNGRFFNKTNRFESIRPKRIGESIRIVNLNALLTAVSTLREQISAIFRLIISRKNIYSLIAATYWWQIPAKFRHWMAAFYKRTAFCITLHPHCVYRAMPLTGPPGILVSKVENSPPLRAKIPQNSRYLIPPIQTFF